MLIDLSKTIIPNHMLPLQIHLLGINHHQEPIYRPKGFPFYQWFYCEKGAGEIIINNHKSIIYEGQGLLLYPEIPHTYQAISSNWTVQCIGFSGTLCGQLLHTLRMDDNGVYHFSNTQLFSNYIYSFLDKYQKNPDISQIDLSKLCYDFLIDLSLCISHHAPDIAAYPNSLIYQIHTYLEEHFQSPITLEHLSEYTGRSREYLCSFYKKHMGRSIINQLTEIRLNHARLYLRQYPNKKTQEIAAMCGFDSPSYFGKIFKKYIKCTPEQYRKK